MPRGGDRRRAPKFDGGITLATIPVLFGIVVNKHAERFTTRRGHLAKRYAICRLVAAQPDQTPTSFDASVRNGFMPTLFPPIEAGSSAAGRQIRTRSGSP
jgi:tricarballylate dehydrogenase